MPRPKRVYKRVIYAESSSSSTIVNPQVPPVVPPIVIRVRPELPRFVPAAGRSGPVRPPSRSQAGSVVPPAAGRSGPVRTAARHQAGVEVPLRVPAAGSKGLEEPSDDTSGGGKPSSEELAATKVGGQIGTSAGILPMLCPLSDGDAGGGWGTAVGTNGRNAERTGLEGRTNAYTKPLVLSYPCVDYCCLVRKLRKAVKGAGKESAPRDPRYIKSRAVKNSAKKAAAAAVLKRQQLKEAKEREAGNNEPSIDTDTGHEAQNNVEESVASEEPVEEPGQELEPEREPVLDQGPADEEEPIAEKERETANEEPPVKAKTVVNLKKVTVRLERLAFNPNGSTKAKKNKAQDADLEGGSSPPEKRRRMTRSTAKVGCSSDGQVTDDEVTRYFARKKIGLTNAKLRHRGPRSSKGHPSMAPKKMTVEHREPEQQTNESQRRLTSDTKQYLRRRACLFDMRC
ncbi:hypothetical protein DAPPUDRAFT_107439 [Daphnia pulex]|uniref:Uncharacterized protein n=1 Tax=Daphnia pulex TaxID=6669 RepID=E9GXG6_DAPPU|nr:hypothetical protein DAPPUDRAFT_107439 [Daphnia pulex]|eukprot:EFX75938.1 hypothetical protein DAPPUDRAFT_107439 [Daphnia pulex]